MSLTRLLAPAKLNLFLHITGRRADGYHELQTLFQLLDYGDYLSFSPQADGLISLHVKRASTPKAKTVNNQRNPDGTPAANGMPKSHGTPNAGPVDARRGAAADTLPMENNLVLRAANALGRETACGKGVSITLEKRLPVGGGLGGGSSNAAVSLLALNRLWALGLSLDELCQIGLGLGADVPVFLRGRSAWGEGVGDELEPVALPEQCYVVVTPPCQVATAAIFNAENLTRNSTKIRIADFFAGGGRNDCEPVTRRLYPAVDEAMVWLGRFGKVRMSGTGASVFLTVANLAEGEKILALLPRGWSGFTARGLARMAHAGGN